MDPDLLVEDQIDDGRRVIEQLVREGFEVTVAFWLKTSEEGSWYLHIASPAIDSEKRNDAYRTVYSALTKVDRCVVTPVNLSLLEATNPAAQAALQLRDRYSGRLPRRFQGKRLGNLTIEEAYIYPRIGGQMTLGEILQALSGMANRPAGAGLQPSVIALRNGSTVTAIITGFNVQMPGELTIQCLDPASNTNGQIPGDEVVNIR